MTCVFHRSFLASRVLFFSASDQLLATETLSRARLSCKYAEKAECGCGCLFVSARPPTLSPARRGNVEVRMLAHLVSCDLTVANLLFYGSHVARSTPVPRHGPHVCDMIPRIGRRQSYPLISRFLFSALIRFFPNSDTSVLITNGLFDIHKNSWWIY